MRAFPILALLFAATAFVAFQGCGSGEPAPNAAPPANALPGAPPAAGAGNTPALTPAAADTPALDAVAKDDWLIELMPAEPPHLNPITSSDYYASQIFELTFSRLLDRDLNTLEFKPEVATAWEVSDDHLTYTFHLRHDVVFSDGEPLTAHDVKFTFDRLKDPTVDAAHLRNYYLSVESAEVVDDYTIRFACSEPYYRHLVMLGMFEILPEHIYGQGDFNNHPNARSPIGSGPYIVERWDTGSSITLARNPKWWGGPDDPRPYYAKRIRRIITDDNAAFEATAAGELDVAGVRAEDWVRRADTARFKDAFNRIAYFQTRYSYLGWNLRKPQFSDKRVRQALTMLLDRESIQKNIYYDLAMIASGNFMPGSAAFDENISPWPFDPVRAAELLDDAGWRDTNGDGIRDKDGAPLQFDLTFTPQSAVAEQIATVFQQELARVGIKMGIRQLEWATMVEQIQDRQFDAFFMGWQMPPDPDPYQVWHSSQGDDGSNYVGFTNAEADAIIEKARVTFDDDERNAMYRRFHQIVHEEQPYTFMFIPKTLVAMDKRIANTEVYVYGMKPLEWYTPAGMAERP